MLYRFVVISSVSPGTALHMALIAGINGLYAVVPRVSTVIILPPLLLLPDWRARSDRA